MGLIDRLARKVAAEIEKAPRQFPPGTKLTDVSQQTNAFGQKQPVAGPALERDPALATTPFPPGMPVPPALINVPREGGRPAPRRFEYPVSWNLPGVGAPPVPWRVLRGFADQVDVVRRCIEVRKSEIVSLDWDIAVNDVLVDEIVAQGETNRGKARATAREEESGEITRLREFWRRPDRLNGLNFADWLNIALEEHFVLDALSLYPHLDLGGDLHSLEVIDGSTIKPLLDARGATPQPPGPAYQQILYGFPRGEFRATVDSDGNVEGFTADDLIYAPRYRRTFTPYGYSNTEQALVIGDLYLKRQEWIRSEYTVGSAPETWMKTDTDWTPEQLKGYEDVMNADLSGNTAERKRIRLLARGFEPMGMSSFAERYSADYDEHLIKILASMFDVQPSEIGFGPKGGLGGKGFMEGQENVTYRRSIRPILTWLTNILNDISRRYLGMSEMLTFSFEGSEVEDDQKIAQTRQIELASGQRPLNEIRAEQGLPLYTFPEADKPYIVTSTGPVFIEGSSASPVPPDGAGAPPATDGAKEKGSGDDTPPAPNAPAPSNGNGSFEEVKKFITFAEKRIAAGVWRPFTFEQVDVNTAEEFNDLGARGDLAGIKTFYGELVKARPKGRAALRARRLTGAAHDELRTKHRDAIGRAIAGMFDAGKMASAAAKLVKASTPESIVRASMRSNKDSIRVLQSIYRDAYVKGAEVSSRLLGVEASFDLENVGAIENLTEYGLKYLLDDAGVTIDSIAESRMEELASRLAGGIDAGLPDKEIGAEIADLLDPPYEDTWADVVASTEVNRAMTTASLDEYERNGVAQKEFITAEDDLVDAECEENAIEGAVDLDAEFPNGDPPVHPNCRCTVAPVVSSEVESQDQEPEEE